jgi:hypothetical protein
MAKIKAKVNVGLGWGQRQSMTVGHKCLSISDHKTAIKNGGRIYFLTSRLAKYDGVTEQKPSNGITG